VASIKSELQRAKEKLISENFQQRWNFQTLATHLESLAGMFERVKKDQHRDLIGQFHDCAGKLPYVWDQDYGALVLEHEAETITDPELRIWILTEARFRAAWCAQGATAGGEAISRWQYVKRLDEKLSP